MATVTTIFRPHSTCYAPSNLWLDASNTAWPCGTEISQPPVCTFIQLGRPGDRNHGDPCHQNNWITTGGTILTNTAYSACPEGMTGVQTETIEFADITTVETICCPTAYDFAAATLAQPSVPLPIPGDGTTYSWASPSTYTVCKATSVKDLSDQEVILTVLRAHWQPTSITKTQWDYENGFIVAKAAVITKRLYTDPVAGTTSTCFGPWWDCAQSNPFVPRPTAAPRPWDRDTLHPLPAVTQPTPAPSCPSAANLWFASRTCPAPFGNSTRAFHGLAL